MFHDLYSNVLNTAYFDLSPPQNFLNKIEGLSKFVLTSSCVFYFLYAYFT